MWIGCDSNNLSWFWIGDGFCDDVTNNANCHFDGGDCCGLNVNTDWCTECQCLNDGTTTIGNVGTDAGTSSLLIFDNIMSWSPSYY